MTIPSNPASSFSFPCGDPSAVQAGLTAAGAAIGGVSAGAGSAIAGAASTIGSAVSGVASATAAAAGGAVTAVGGIVAAAVPFLPVIGVGVGVYLIAKKFAKE